MNEKEYGLMLLSRPPTADPHGKCDDRIDTPLPVSVKEDFAALAVLLGYGSAAELNRKLIEDYLYGTLSAARLAVRAARVEGNNIR